MKWTFLVFSQNTGPVRPTVALIPLVREITGIMKNSYRYDREKLIKFIPFKMRYLYKKNNKFFLSFLPIYLGCYTYFWNLKQTKSLQTWANLQQRLSLQGLESRMPTTKQCNKFSIFLWSIAILLVQRYTTCITSLGDKANKLLIILHNIEVTFIFALLTLNQVKSPSKM